MIVQPCSRLQASFLVSLLVFSSSDGQTPAPSDSSAARRETLTGDWGGTRSRWQEHGADLQASLTQFYQGVTSGGVRHDEAYNGKFRTNVKFDFGKLAGWQLWHAEIGTETRFGDALLTGTGGLNPVNTTVIVPGSDDTKFAVSSATLTRLVPIDAAHGDLLAFSLGRVNLLDTLQEDFFAGGGLERFMNIAQIGPLTVLRQVPIITNAFSFAYIRRGEPFITFAVLDPNDHETDPGLEDFFSEGATFAPAINFPSKFFGKSGKHTLGGAITTKEYTPFDEIKQVLLPGPPRQPLDSDSGSWSVNYTFRQYLIERGKGDGWGVFGQVSFADQGTSPIATFFDIGLGGNGLFPRRRDDEFGIAYAYTDLSDELKDNLDLLRIRGVRSEHQFEVFYNAHITPWLRLTGDVQVIRPIRKSVDTAVVPAIRLQIVF